MSIRTEHYEIGETGYTYTYSDAGYYIKEEKTGDKYVAVFDLADQLRIYAETDEPTGRPTDDTTYAEIGRILLGDD